MQLPITAYFWSTRTWPTFPKRARLYPVPLAVSDVGGTVDPMSQLEITRYFRKASQTLETTPVAARTFRPQSSCGELLYNNYPATDVQKRDAQNSIHEVEREILATDSEVARLQLRVSDLRKQRAQLFSTARGEEDPELCALHLDITCVEVSIRQWVLQSQQLRDFIQAERRVIALVRHVPNELLAEIFAYCVALDTRSQKLGHYCVTLSIYAGPFGKVFKTRYFLEFLDILVGVDISEESANFRGIFG
ncbi:hypothetical protein C8F01DRAFT_1365374 [Mycena amicta]|nr:hypothetical protein C8F01DRAFT_1365374 [Mycena amicta]